MTAVSLPPASPPAGAAADDLVLRPLTPADLPAAHALSLGFHWPHRLEDWTLFAALGQGLVAERQGRMVGTTLWWDWGERTASVGMVMVDPACQSGGIGRRLMAAVIAGHPGISLILNATEAGAPLYRRLGFTPYDRLRQHQGPAAGAPLAPPAGTRLRPLTPADHQAMTALDQAASGLWRPRLMTALLDQGEGVALERDGIIIGQALFRRFGRGYVIGPVAAADPLAAQVLISHWLTRHPGQFIRIDVPADGGLSPWLDDQGLTGLEPVATMSLGPPPAGAAGMTSFALTAQALG